MKDGVALDDTQRIQHQNIEHLVDQMTAAYCAGDDEKYDQTLASLTDVTPSHCMAAALNAYVSNQRQTADQYPFCPDAISMVLQSNYGKHIADAAGQLARIASAIKGLDYEESPALQSVEGGRQSRDPIFAALEDVAPELPHIITAELTRYQAKFASSTAGLITDWPQDTWLDGWSVCMTKQGRHVPHIHPMGWVSGVLYVSVPDPEARAGGHLAFDTKGFALPSRHDGGPKLEIIPKTGDLILFPSSLFHGTTPLTSDAERITISFDMIPRTRM